MSGDEDDIWGAYAKGVKKLHDKPQDEEPPPQQKKRKPHPQQEPLPWAGIEGATEPALIDPPKPVAAPPPPAAPWKKEPLDLRVERNMSLGDVVIEGKIDLHGKTESDAYDAFRDFVEKNYTRSRRMLLVITGKGANGASVIRANLPRWCDAPPFDALVMAVRTAAQHHGGEGAYYVLLRKRAA